MGKGVEWALQAQPREDVERAGGGGWQRPPDTSFLCQLTALWNHSHFVCVCVRARKVSKV